MTIARVRLPPKTLLEQAAVSLRELRASPHAAHVSAMVREGLPSDFIAQLEEGHAALVRADAAQRSAALRVDTAKLTTKAATRAGADWLTGLQKRVKLATLLHPEHKAILKSQLPLPRVFNRTAGVIRNLRQTLPLVAAVRPLLQAQVDDALLAEGARLLADLDRETVEAAALRKAKVAATKALAASRAAVVAQLTLLEAIDDVVARTTQVPPAFTLDVLHAEAQRREAVSKSKKAARAAKAAKKNDPDED